jgi:hypothetical protein
MHAVRHHTAARSAATAPQHRARSAARTPPRTPSLAALCCLWALAALVLAAAPQARAQAVYKCAGPGGQVVFQQAPCAGAGGRVEVRQGNVMDATPVGIEHDLLRSAKVREATERGLVLSGMTAQEVERALGAPHAHNRSAGSYGTREQLVYRGDGVTRYVYLDDGRVSSMSVSEHGMRAPRTAPEPCYSDLEIRNAEVGVNSVTLPPEERARRRATADRMRTCRR